VKVREFLRTNVQVSEDNPKLPYVKVVVGG